MRFRSDIIKKNIVHNIDSDGNHRSNNGFAIYFYTQSFQGSPGSDQACSLANPTQTYIRKTQDRKNELLVKECVVRFCGGLLDYNQIMRTCQFDSIRTATQ